MNDALVSLGSVRARGIALLIVVAIAAGVAGGAIDRWLIQRSVTPSSGAVPGAGIGERRDSRFEGERGRAAEGEIPLSLRAVTLSPDQIVRIRAITARYRPAAESLMLNVRPRVLAIDLQMRQEAMCVLSPAQRAEWIAWRKREGLAVEEGNQMLKLVNSDGCPSDTKAKE